MKGKGNPADDALRKPGSRKETSSSRWFTGLAFLWQRQELRPSYSSKVTCMVADDPEIKDDVIVSAVQLVNYAPENVEKSHKFV